MDACHFFKLTALHIYLKHTYAFAISFIRSGDLGLVGQKAVNDIVCANET